MSSTPSSALCPTPGHSEETTTTPTTYSPSTWADVEIGIARRVSLDRCADAEDEAKPRIPATATSWAALLERSVGGGGGQRQTDDEKVVSVMEYLQGLVTSPSVLDEEKREEERRIKRQRAKPRGKAVTERRCKKRMRSERPAAPPQTEKDPSRPGSRSTHRDATLTSELKENPPTKRRALTESTVTACAALPTPGYTTSSPPTSSCCSATHTSPLAHALPPGSDVTRFNSLSDQLSLLHSSAIPTWPSDDSLACQPWSDPPGATMSPRPLITSPPPTAPSTTCWVPPIPQEVHPMSLLSDMSQSPVLSPLDPWCDPPAPPCESLSLGVSVSPPPLLLWPPLL